MNAARSEPLGYELALERAGRLGDAKALKALQKIGPPPYADPRMLRLERQALGRVGVETFPELRDLLSAALFSPGYTLRDSASFFQRSAVLSRQARTADDGL